jgi:hypothetical protein
VSVADEHESDGASEVVIGMQYRPEGTTGLLGVLIVSVGVDSEPTEFTSAPVLGPMNDARRARLATAVIALVGECLSEDGQLGVITRLAGPGVAQALGAAVERKDYKIG